MTGLVLAFALAAGFGPPSPVLSTPSDQLVAARGSYCWHTGSEGLCVDTLPPVTKRALAVRLGGRIRVGMGTATDSVHASLRGGHARRLRVRRIDASHFVVRVPSATKRRGVLDLFARYPQGDGFFGARLRVR